MKQKELLRSYRFREYLKQLGMNRRFFKELPDQQKVDIFNGYKEWVKG